MHISVRTDSEAPKSLPMTHVTHLYNNPFTGILSSESP